MSPSPTIGAPQATLRRLREVMAAHLSPQDRLERIVRLVAANMVAEVSSIYLVRGRELVLAATHGLNRSAVGRTVLKWGEGLVGEIARTAAPLSLTDAQSHEKFAYRPETGEDPYHSLLGVPILRAGDTMGVLVIQNEVKRQYTEEEVEILQTIAMVLAEIVATSGLMDAKSDAEAPKGEALRLSGMALAEGMAVGTVVMHEPRVRVTRLFAEDTSREIERLDEAVGALRASVDKMLTASGSLQGESRQVLEAFRMFAYDRGWLERLREAVLTGLTAEAAVERVQNNTRAKMQRQRDPYIRERLHDLDDLANRVLRHLAGRPTTAAADEVPSDAIIVARNMGPAELLDYDRHKVRGVVLEEGSPGSHVAIVARALGVPLVGIVPDVLERCDAGDRVIVDGDHGEVHVRPEASILQAFEERQTIKAQRRAQFEALRHEPAITLDGEAITLRINAGLLVDLPHLDETGADGIGLFRTELQFMVSATMPRLTAQTELYRKVLDAADERSVVFRTLDLGGDKVLPYGVNEQEENPALGWRAVRIALDRPALLRYQVRALLAAAEGRPLNIMFPMVAEVSEFVAARKLVDAEVELMHRRGRSLPSQIRVGTMLEVPSLAWQLDSLLPIIDFVSVGSNDLMQFLFACDRDNARMAGRYDPLSPPVLSFLRHLLRKARDHDVDLSLCGEMAGNPLEAMALIGLGFRSISMPPSSIGPVKVMVRSLHLGELEGFIEGLVDLPDHSVRPHLQAYAQDHAVAL